MLITVLVLTSAITNNVKQVSASMASEAKTYYMGETVKGTVGWDSSHYYKITIKKRQRLTFDFVYDSGINMYLYNSSGDEVILRDTMKYTNTEKYNATTEKYSCQYAENLPAGTYYLEINGSYHSYQATVEAEDIVTLSKGSITSLKSTKSKSLTVVNKKVSKAYGYIIKYSTTENFKKNVKTKKVTSYKTTLKGLKKKTKYYVKTRPYYIYEDRTYVYGKWSKAKSRKTK